MNYLLAFIFCGLVCVIAQLIYEYTKLTPGFHFQNQEFGY